MADRPTKPVVFYNSTRKQMEIVQVRSPTGWGSDDHMFRQHCHNLARKADMTHWAQPAWNVENNTFYWQIFQLKGSGARSLVHTVPSQEAAEMWLRHCA